LALKFETVWKESLVAYFYFNRSHSLGVFVVRYNIKSK